MAGLGADDSGGVAVIRDHGGYQVGAIERLDAGILKECETTGDLRVV